VPLLIKGLNAYASVIQYLKKHGQLLDLEIVAATEIPVEQVRISLAELSEQGEIHDVV